jgi:hypothetical protein
MFATTAQEEEAQPEIQRQYCLGRAISGGEVDDYDGRERKVANEPPTFPEFIEEALKTPFAGSMRNRDRQVTSSVWSFGLPTVRSGNRTARMTMALRSVNL